MKLTNNYTKLNKPEISNKFQINQFNLVPGSVIMRKNDLLNRSILDTCECDFTVSRHVKWRRDNEQNNLGKVYISRALIRNKLDIKLCTHIHTLFSLIMLNMLYKIIVYRITLNVCPEVINKSFWKWCIGHMYIKLCTHIHTLFSLIMLNMLYKIIVYRITLNVCPEVINKSFWKWCIGHMYIKLCTHIQLLYLVWLCSICCTKLLCIESLWMFVQKL